MGEMVRNCIPTTTKWGKWWDIQRQICGSEETKTATMITIPTNKKMYAEKNGIVKLPFEIWEIILFKLGMYFASIISGHFIDVVRSFVPLYICKYFTSIILNRNSLRDAVKNRLKAVGLKEFLPFTLNVLYKDFLCEFIYKARIFRDLCETKNRYSLHKCYLAKRNRGILFEEIFYSICKCHKGSMQGFFNWLNGNDKFFFLVDIHVYFSRKLNLKKCINCTLMYLFILKSQFFNFVYFEYDSISFSLFKCTFYDKEDWFIFAIEQKLNLFFKIFVTNGVYHCSFCCGNPEITCVQDCHITKCNFDFYYKMICTKITKIYIHQKLNLVTKLVDDEFFYNKNRNFNWSDWNKNFNAKFSGLRYNRVVSDPAYVYFNTFKIAIIDRSRLYNRLEI